MAKNFHFLNMLKQLLILAGTVAGTELYAADWSGWRDNTGSGRVIWGNGFENRTANPFRLGCYSIEPHSGLNGGGALCLTRHKPEDYFFQEITLENVAPGELYQLRLHVRGENLSQWKIMSFAGLEFKGDKDKWISGSYIGGEVEQEDFRRYTLDFTVPANAKKTNMVLFMSRGVAGKLFFDDVEVVSRGSQFTAIPLKPSTALTIRPDEKDFRFQIDPAAPAEAEAIVSVTQNGKTSDIRLGLDRRKQLTGKWPQLSPGPVDVEINVINAAGRLRLGATRFAFQKARRSPLPAGSCLIDDRGRAVVNGKPFMPLGVFTDRIDREMLRRLRDNGFNCLISYSSLQRSGEAETRRQLDLMQQYGIKAIFSLKDQPDNVTSWQIREWEGASGGLAVAVKAVSSLRNHPALLAWYICDEAVRLHVPAIQKMREVIAAADPYHPTYSLTNMWANFPYYGLTGDIAGVDPYPVKAKGKTQSIEEVTTALQAASLSSQPIWITLQAFNRGIYSERPWNAAALDRTRAPSREEMRAMCLLSVIYGAKGFLFYSYMDAAQRYEAARPGSSAAELQKLYHCAGELKRLEPFILEAESRAVPQSGPVNPTIHCRYFRLPTGEVRIVIVADNATPGKAVFRFNGTGKLISRFGLTRPLPDGSYEFSSARIDSDILESVPADDGRPAGN